MIENALSKHPEGLSINELASICKVTKGTIRGDIKVLLATKRIVQREIGNVKLHYHKDHARSIQSK